MNVKPVKPKKISKSWGYELWLANNKDNNYCGKILSIRERCSTSMHFHVNKHETFYVLEGILKIQILNTETASTEELVVVQGDTYEINRAIPHKLIAMNGPVKFIEVSTFHEDSDSYRVWK